MVSISNESMLVAEDEEQSDMKPNPQAVCFWSGYAFLPVYLLGFVALARFIPPPAPGLSDIEITGLFERERFQILSGMAVCVVGSVLYLPWSVAISGQMRRMEGSFPTLAWVQMLCGAVAAVFFMLSPLIWATLAFRTGHNPDVIQILNDAAWIAWLLSWPFFMVQWFAVGLCSLMPRQRQELIPRWLGFFSIFGSFTMVPVLFVIYMKSGPFAWNGIFGIYLPFGLFAIWYHLVSFAVWRGIKNEAVSEMQL